MKTIRICLAADNNFIPPALVTISSILRNKNLDEEIELFMLHSDLTEKNQNYIKRIVDLYTNSKITFVKTDEKLYQRYYTERWKFASAYRLKCASLLRNFDKILYLDCDIYVKKSLWELYSTNIENAYGALVPSMRRRFVCMRKKQPSFNTGVFLINLKKWREDNIEQKFDECFDKNKDIISLPDQDVINLTLDGHIIELSYKYNYSPYNCLEEPAYDEIENDPVIIHYIGIKPWNIDLEYVNNLDAWKDKFYAPLYFGEICRFPEDIFQICKCYFEPVSLKKSSYKLFNFLTFLKVKEYSTHVQWYLFGFIPFILKIKKPLFYN